MGKKIKVALLTIDSLNIGAVLQAFATKEYIIQTFKNFEVDLLRMNCGTDYTAGVFGKYSSNFLRNAVLNILEILKYPRKKKGFRRKNKFKKNHFSFIPCNSLSDFITNIPQYDIYLTGSDQVFRPDAERHRKDIFFQRFDVLGAKKMAYAPSFGVSEFSDEFFNEMKDSILDFDALSCREQSGADFLSKVTGRSIPWVVDPTLLLDAQSWNQIAVKPKYTHKYIFIYDLNGAESLIEIAQKIKVQTGLKIVCLTQKAYKFYKVDKQIYSAGPAEFLGWIANAEYVVTDSFHGTIFSINYNKPFTSYIAFKKVSGRILSFLEVLSLTDRVVDNSKSFRFTPDLLVLSYNRQVLSSFIDASRSYLNCCFKDE